VTLHTDIPTRSEVESLLRARGSPCVSIYLATSPVTQQSQAERIELKNLVAEAAEQIEVADRFYAKPLLRAVTFSQAGFVLALAAGSVRLVEVAGEGPPFTVHVPGLPTDAASAAGKASIADRSPSRSVG
jgi:Bacterial archaeo-eukaryotic release factor family 11